MKVTSRKTIAMLSAGILTLSCIPVGMFHVSATSAVTENALQLGAPVTIDNNLVCEVLEQKEDETFLLKITDVKDKTITSLTFPEEYDGYPIQFVELGDSVFKNCTNLTEITLPDEISAIPKQAFYGCTSLTTVNASENIVSIGEDAFYNTPILNDQYDENGNEVVIKYFGDWVIGMKSSLGEDERDISIKEGTVGIADCSFSKYYSINDISIVQIPSTLKYIGNSAFNNIWAGINFTDIVLPEGLKTIGNRAFESSSITEITVPGTVEYVGESAFSDSKIEKAVIEPGVKEIKDGAFNGCSKLTTVTIGDGIEKIGQLAFAYNDSLTDVTIGEGLKELQGYSFANCKFLKKIDLPDSLVSISSTTFQNSAIMENGLTQLKYADNWLIGYNTNHTDDSEVTVKKGTVGIASEALKSHKMETLNLPDGLKYINSKAISYTSNLETVTLPESLEKIDDNVFNSSHITEITIPKNVSYIGESAFYFSYLKKITILNPDCEIVDGYNTLKGTIYGFNISTAHDYADAHNRKFVALDAVETTTTTEATTTTTTTITTTTTAPVTTTAPTTTTTEAELMQGDVDGDDVISVSDAVDVLKIYAMSAAGMDVSDFTAAQFQAADVDGDGVVAVSDAVYLLTYYARKAAGIDVTWDDIVNK